MEMTNRNIQSLFNHLCKSYSEEEAKEILIQKYPDAEDDINYVVSELPRDPVVEVNTLARAVEAKQAKPKAEKKTRAKQTGSKMDKARQMYAAAEDKSRKAMMELFMSELGLGKAAASTYYYSVKG